MSRAQRKMDHLRGALKLEQAGESGLSDIRFVHNSLSEVKTSEISLETEAAGLKFESPLYINAMTGGGGKATETINGSLAEAAGILGIPVAVGSQMSAIKDPSERSTYEVVRKRNQEGLVFANVGSEASVSQALACIDMLEADALQIHLNVIQELVMPEGDRDFTGTLHRIRAIAEESRIPIIVKEVGFGMTREAAGSLFEAGALIVDVGGHGGTNFSVIENERRDREMAFFNEWGIPTACSVAEVCEAHPGKSVFASGGIRSASDVAKSLALGASAAGMAGRILSWVQEGGVDNVVENIHSIENELKWIMTALGITDISSFQTVPAVISGSTHHWLTERGIRTEAFSRRMPGMKT
ncbi:type 2 isopentenyl-diphosphate Delta-isomerase [Alteribacter natronophilus]|uniref:type 2 isopentenyl-diphosphate Delta-isomerase n=1 Tax=Alteribacter natronophilus TaxID=2583810 RepID=UPI00110D8917|nr:type 2 isopentenyl-diphosphate Delta-isomerase [Alteribacter natronophilus]TMW73616.1 type 2 isopentenyl-diphosphate Delta-isomerase [Alteribacter natronophilus]